MIMRMAPEPAPLRVTLSVGAVLGFGGLGGASHIARALHEQGCDVTVVCAGDISPDSPWRLRVVNTHSLVRATHWTPLRGHSGFTLALQNNYFDWRARSLIGAPDALYAYSDQGLYSLAAARKTGIPTMLHAATIHVRRWQQLLATECARQGHGQRMVTSLMVRKVEREYREAAAIRAESSLTEQTLVEAGVNAAKICLIPPSVDTERFQPADRTPDHFTIVFVGSFDLNKGLPYLLQAFDLIGRRDMHMILHGGSGSRFINRMLAPYRVRHDVSFASGDPAPTFRRASVCVVPSIADGFAYVALEALACGVPVIVSERVGGKDAITDGENGFIVPVGDATAIAERIRALHDSPALLARMQQRARATALAYSRAREGQALAGALAALRGGGI